MTNKIGYSVFIRNILEFLYVAFVTWGLFHNNFAVACKTINMECKEINCV